MKTHKSISLTEQPFLVPCRCPNSAWTEFDWLQQAWDKNKVIIWESQDGQFIEV